MLSRCRGAKLHVRRGCWRLGMRYPARRLERGCGRCRGTRGSRGAGGAGVRVRSACAWPASGMVACRVSRTIGCERERGHASAGLGAGLRRSRGGAPGQKRPVWSAMELNVDCPTARIVFGSWETTNQRLDRTKLTLSTLFYTNVTDSPHLLHRSIGRSGNRHG